MPLKNKTTLKDKAILLIISGGVAAYKALELIRLLRQDGAALNCILTTGGAKFITPLSVSALSGRPAYTDLWSLKDEAEMGHIRLSRESDLIVVAPASANLIAHAAHGMADDLATATLLAADKPVLFAPAMNPMMWRNPATRDNVALLQKRGWVMRGPEEGEMACGESGPGRMRAPEDLLDDIAALAALKDKTPPGKSPSVKKTLNGYKALVTSGPTYEPLDPVRFLGNHSSGKQGHAIAAALQEAGATVTLISGPTALPAPDHVHTLHVQTASEMHAACLSTLPADIAVCAAAVSDWAPQKTSPQKIKKQGKSAAAKENKKSLALQENPDILAALSKPGGKRPALVVGFAAETEDLLVNARRKHRRKGCDWLVANLVGAREKGFGADTNQVYLIRDGQEEHWPEASKAEIARRLVNEISAHMLQETLQDDGPRQNAAS